MLSGVDPCDAEEQSTHKIYKTLPESVSQNTMDAIICGLQKETVRRPNDIASFQNILEHGIHSTANSSFSNNAGDGRIPTDTIIPDSPKPISTKLIAIACVAVVSLGGWFAWNKFNKNEGGNATEHSANNDTQQSQKKDTTSVIADSLMPEHVDIKEHVAKTSKRMSKNSQTSQKKRLSLRILTSQLLFLLLSIPYLPSLALSILAMPHGKANCSTASLMATEQ